jgi:hypothetical protein
MQKSDREIARIFAEAKRVAGLCLNISKDFPDRSEVNAVACALIAGQIVRQGRPVRTVNHQGADADQDEKLGRVYGDR